MEDVAHEFFASLPNSKRVLAERLREAVRSGDKGGELTESVRWKTRPSGKTLTFTHGKDNVAFIYTYMKADYMSLGFFFATALQDPDGLFEGTGKGMRHIKVRAESDIPPAQIKKWVREALGLLKE